MKKFLDYVNEKPVTEAMDKNLYNKISGIITEKDLETFFKVSKSLKAEILDEGFNMSDASEFLRTVLNQHILKLVIK